MIIDFVGALAYIYRYATWAYVGGGFTRLLHSVIEPAVYGLPVAFGPNVNRKAVTRRMIELGIGRITATPEALDEWFRGLKDDDEGLREIADKAVVYVSKMPELREGLSIKSDRIYARKIKICTLQGAFGALSLLPFPLLYGLSDLLYLVMAKGVKYRRKVIRENLRNSFPEKASANCLISKKISIISSPTIS